MLTYQGKQISRFKEKSGGKNNSEVDGFYQTEDGQQQYFIKKPADKAELFAELFAGLLLREFMKRNLIDEIYFPSLICADVIKFEDGSYGLIQPLVAFDELYKIIGTGYSDQSDRDPKIETLMGPRYYPTLTQQGKYFGLSIALMFSLLLGAHSVHSGNIVRLKNILGTLSRQYGRIDWGDAFRNYAHPDNNTDILYAYENQGLFNIKKLTKGYFLNYKNIPGLFPAMAERARQLSGQVNDRIMFEIVCSAMANIPADLIDQDTKDKLAKYMFMPSLTKTTFGSDGSFREFAEQMTRVLNERLGKITHLQDLVAQPSQSLYASIISFPPIALTHDSEPFPEVLHQWHEIISSSNRHTPIDSNGLDLTKLAHSFNQYVNSLAHDCEAANIWAHDPSAGPYNIFAPFYKGDGSTELGHAFVHQYKESTLLRQLCTMEPHTLILPRFQAFERPCEAYTHSHEHSPWAKIQRTLGLGSGIIRTLKMIRQEQEFGMDEGVKEHIKRLQEQLHEFGLAEAEVRKIFTNPSMSVVKQPGNSGSNFFYPMNDEALLAMTGDQLATICLEELNDRVPSILIERILKNDTLWSRIDLALDSGVFNARLDNPEGKINKLREWRSLLLIAAVRTDLTFQQLVKEHEKQIEHLKGTVRDLEERNRDLGRREQESIDGKGKAELSVKNLTEDLRLLKLSMQEQQKQSVSDIESLTKQIQTKEKQIKQLEGSVSDLSQKDQLLLKTTEENERNKTLVHSLELQILTLKSQIKKIQEESSTQIRSLERQIKEKEGQALELQQQLVKQHQTNRELELLVQDIKKERAEEVQALKKELSGLNKQIKEQEAQFKSQLSSLEKQIQEKKLQIQSITGTDGELRQRNQTLEKRVQEGIVVGEELERLKLEMKQLRQEASIQKSSLGQQIKDKEERALQLQQELSQFREKNQELETLVKQIKREKDEQVHALQVEHDSLKQEMSEQKLQFKAQLSLLDRQIEEKEQRINSLTSSDSGLRQRNQELEKTVRESLSLGEELAQLKLELQKLKESSSAQILSLDHQIKDNEQQALQLQQDLTQRNSKNKELQQLLEQIRREKLTAEQSVQSLTQQVSVLSHRIEEVQHDLSGQVDSLQKQLKEKEELVKRLSSDLQKRKDRDHDLERELGIVGGERNVALGTIRSLTEELSSLKDQLKQLQEQLISKDKGASLLGQQSQQIVSLEGLIKQQKIQLAELTQQLLTLRSEHEDLQVHLRELTREKSLDQVSIKRFEGVIEQLHQQVVNLSHLLSQKEQAITELKQQLSQQTVKASLADEKTIEAKKAKQVEARLKKEVDALQQEIKKQQLDLGRLQHTISLSVRAEGNFTQALEERRDIYFARMERMAPILLQINSIEEKAKDLHERQETEAYNAAKRLASGLRSEVRKYAESTETNEDTAISTFKEHAKQHVNGAKNVLNEHRKEWKYILANIAISILLLGVGYIPAILLNKGINGNYTFFSQTASGKEVQVLEEKIAATNLNISVGA